MGKLDTTLDQRTVCLADIRNAEVKDRVGGRRRVALYQHKTRACAVEERHIAECVQMLQAEQFAIPTLCAFDIADRSRYLANWPNTGFDHVRFHLTMKCAVLRRSEPAAKCLAIRQAKLRKRILEMELDPVLADSDTVRDLAIRHSVLYRMRDAPFSGRKNIVVGSPPSSPLSCHREILAPTGANFPPLPCAHDGRERLLLCRMAPFPGDVFVSGANRRAASCSMRRWPAPGRLPKAASCQRDLTSLPLAKFASLSWAAGVGWLISWRQLDEREPGSSQILLVHRLHRGDSPDGTDHVALAGERWRIPGSSFRSPRTPGVYFALDRAGVRPVARLADCTSRLVGGNALAVPALRSRDRVAEEMQDFKAWPAGIWQPRGSPNGAGGARGCLHRHLDLRR
jgi:hypothetical protein